MGFDIFEIIRSVYVEYLWKWNCWKLLFWIYWECWFFFNCDNYFLGCIWVHHIHYEERELNISLRKFSSTQQIILSFWNDSTKSKLNEQWWHITYVSRRRLVAELHARGNSRAYMYKVPACLSPLNGHCPRQVWWKLYWFHGSTYHHDAARNVLGQLNVINNNWSQKRIQFIVEASVNEWADDIGSFFPAQPKIPG